MASDLWSPYSPDAKQPWDLPRVVHLHRRAGFAGTWAELQRDLKDGPETSIARLLGGTANLHASSDYEATTSLLSDAAVSQGEIGRLKAAWFFRFLSSPDPLVE